MLLKSMEFAKQDIIARLLREAEIEANRSIEEIKSAFTSDIDLLTTSEITAINQQIKIVEQAIKSGNRDEIDGETEKLHNVSRNFAEKRMDKAIISALKGKDIKDDI
jgi:molecular chaperone HscA